MNKVILLGNTTRAIEMRHLPSGIAVSKTGLAVNKTWRDKLTGEQKQEVMFIDIEMFGKSAEIANQYMTKGKKILIEGELRLGSWLDQSGQRQSKHTVTVESFEFLDSKRDGEGTQNTNTEYSYDDGTTKQVPTTPKPNINIDEETLF